MTSYIPIQDGFYHPAQSPWLGTGLWTDSEVLAVYKTDGPIGLIFDVTGSAFTSISLTLNKQGFSDGDGTLHLYLLNAATPEFFSNGNLPAVAGANLIASVATQQTVFGFLVFNLDMAVVAALMALSGWAGRLAFVLTFETIASAGFRVFPSSERESEAGRPTLEIVEIQSSPTPATRILLRRPHKKRYQPHPRTRIRTER